jgi:hypothetical protein
MAAPDQAATNRLRSVHKSTVSTGFGIPGAKCYVDVAVVEQKSWLLTLQ